MAQATITKRPVRNRTVVLCVLVAALALAAVGWAHERRPEPPEAAQIVPQLPPCPAPGDFPGAPARDLPEAGSIPAGFVPVAIWTCSMGPGSTILDAPAPNGSPVGTVYTVGETRSSGDLTDLIAALSHRSQPQRWPIEAWWGAETPPWRPNCPWGYECNSTFWLVDRDGRAIRPAIPTQRSGAPDPAVGRAVAQLKVETIASHDFDCPLDVEVKPAPGEPRSRDSGCRPR